MPGKLFVGNLSFNVSDAELNEFCSSLNIKTESIKIMRDMETGKSRGFAFIELSPEADMEGAIKELNAKTLDGRAITVNEARPLKPRDSNRGGGGRDFGNRSGKFRGRDSQRKEPARPKRKIQELY
jgi:RNA recognition motif-containing protein